MSFGFLKPCLSKWFRNKIGLEKPNHVYESREEGILFKDFIYLFLEKGEGREKEREISICGCLSCGPRWGPGPQPRHVPWLGIERKTLWFAAHAQSTELHQPGPDLPISDRISKNSQKNFKVSNCNNLFLRTVSSISFCLTYFNSLLFGAYTLRIVMPS